MRFLSLALALSAAVALGACGEQAADSTTSDSGTSGASDSADAGPGAGIALAGGAWDGGTGIDPTKQSGKIRVLAFFKPG